VRIQDLSALAISLEESKDVWSYSLKKVSDISVKRIAYTPQFFSASLTAGQGREQIHRSARYPTSVLSRMRRYLKRKL
jgi:hypothetical protein